MIWVSSQRSSHSRFSKIVRRPPTRTCSSSRLAQARKMTERCCLAYVAPSLTRSQGVVVRSALMIAPPALRGRVRAAARPDRATPGLGERGRRATPRRRAPLVARLHPATPEHGAHERRGRASTQKFWRAFRESVCGGVACAARRSSPFGEARLHRTFTSGGTSR